MFPWLWLWTPQFHFPLSGDIAQDIEPQTHWFFSGIPPGAGDGALERRIFETASYGTQLGLITEVLLSLAAKGTVDPDQARQALADLKAVYRDIEAVKQSEKDSLETAAGKVLERLERRDPEALARVLKRYRPSGS